MQAMKYLSHYSDQTRAQVALLIEQNKLADVLRKRYPASHDIRTDRALYDYIQDMKTEFLRMIAVHELAHVKEKQHDKAFYKLCTYMEPNYHQYEFDLRLYLTELDLSGKRLW